MTVVVGVLALHLQDTQSNIIDTIVAIITMIAHAHLGA